jgi:hypothetical protein
MLRALAVAACWFGIIAPGALAAPVDFRPRFTAGAEARVTMKIDQRYTMPGSMGMADLNSDTSQMVVLRERVKSAEAGKGAEVELTYERVVFSGQTQVGRVDFDSASYRGDRQQDPMSMTMDATPMVAKHLQGLVGTTLTVKFDAEGKITSVDGRGDEGIPMMMGPICGLKPEAQSLTVVFSPADSMPPERARAAEVGKAWDFAQTLDISPMGLHTMKLSQALRSADESQAVLEFTGRFEQAEDKNRQVSYAKMTDSRINGRVMWDVKPGRMLRSETEIMTKVGTSDGAGGSMNSTNQSRVTIVREPR